MIDYLPNKYAVTDKADGLRNFMVIHETRCYLISTNLIVKDTGIDVDTKFNNTIIDGELIFKPQLNQYIFMAFDCLISCGRDVREEPKFLKRLEYLDEIIEAINPVKFKFKSLYDGKTDLNNIEKILEIHSSNIKLFYDDLDIELKKKQPKMIFRRKYFMECLGINDNEIFKYTVLLWNMYTSDNSIKCPYLLDGIIYQPLEQKYVVEEDKIKFHEYKWKPPHRNSIDFYIEFEKDRDTGKILSIYDNSINDVVKNKPYQIINLFAGQSNKGVEKPVIFSTGNNVSQCYVYLDDNGIPRSIDGKQINDKTVVEFYYNLMDDILAPYRWIPINTRFDKTESIQKYGKKYGNSYITATKIWRSITNPILMTDFNNLSDDITFNKYYKQLKLKIDVSAIKLDKQQNIYYQKKTHIVDNMNKFHNWIKSNVMYTYINPLYCNNIQNKVLELGIGKGGDIMKYYYTLVEMVVGIDVDMNGLTNASDGAIARYQHARKTHDNFPPMYFIHADGGNLLQYDEQVKSIGKMNSDNKKLFDKFFTWDNRRTIFDRVSSQFVIHYFFANDKTFDNFTQNINMYLREGGYIMFTCFDGDKIKEKLKDREKYNEHYTDNGEKKLLYEIVKKYDDNDKKPLGQSIDVHMGWIFEDDVYVTEYLVYKDFVIKAFKEKCNLELVETGLFEDMFNDNREFLKVASVEDDNPKTRKTFGDVYKFYEDSEINKKSYTYSFLNRFYVFRKTESNLSEIKAKYYVQDKKKNIPSKIAYKKKK